MLDASQGAILDNKITQINSKLGFYNKTFTSSDLLNYGDFVGTKSRISRTGNTVAIYIDGGITKDTYETRWNGFLKIPTGYKPHVRVTGIGYGLYGDPTTSIAIDNDTMMFVKNAVNTNNGALSIYFSATWITSDNFPN